MDEGKNGGPNYLQAWREHKRMTQEELADAVGTTGAVISLLEAGERGLSAKWLRRLAPVLGTTPGHLLEHDPSELDADIVDIWMSAGPRERRQIVEIAKTLVRSKASG